MDRQAIPTHKFVRIRERNRILEGGWRDEAFRRATSIRIFPNVDEMARKMPMIVRNRGMRIPPTSEEQNIPVVRFSDLSSISTFLNNAEI